VAEFGDSRLPERFWDKVIASPSGCWCWAASGSYGYGSYAPGGCGSRRAHRASYEALVGTIPENLQLDHLCRNRCCVNPAHLEPVTGQVNILRGTSPAARNAKKTHCPKGHEYSPENVSLVNGFRNCRVCHRAKIKRQRRAKRRPPGSLPTGLKLTAAQVREIRERFANGERYAALAERFQVSKSMIGDIVRRKLWRKLDPHLPVVGDFSFTKLRPEQVSEIRRRHESGQKPRSIAADFGVAARTVHSIVQRKCWRHIP
jgi:hypothetical protein